jgi:hypothetical protein
VNEPDVEQPSPDAFTVPFHDEPLKVIVNDALPLPLGGDGRGQDQRAQGEGKDRSLHGATVAPGRRWRIGGPPRLWPVSGVRARG